MKLRLGEDKYKRPITGEIPETEGQTLGVINIPEDKILLILVSSEEERAELVLLTEDAYQRYANLSGNTVEWYDEITGMIAVDFTD